MPDILKSWKTTVAGVAIIGLCVAFALGRITLDQFLMGFGAIAGGGFLVAGDHK